MQDACAVTALVRLGDGGSPDWSPDGRRIACMRWEGRAWGLHLVDPDGAPAVWLPAPTPDDGPPLNVCGPAWHPSGSWIIVQLEMAANPLRSLNDMLTAELWVNGHWTDLWAVTPDGAHWAPLTRYSATATDGAMLARCSADGTRLLWSRIVAPAGPRLPFGQYRLMLGEIAPGWPPTLQNVQDITPPGPNLIEAGGFSPDGRMVYFTADQVGDGPWSKDIYAMSLASGQVTNLTKSPHWEEHPSLSPSGRAAAYMSSAPYLVWFSHTELLLRAGVGVDGGGATRQLTHFNVAGAPEYQPNGAMPCRSSWSPDGAHLVLETQASIGGGYPARQLWRLDFAGGCG